jgi:hypothetical protein
MKKIITISLVGVILMVVGVVGLAWIGYPIVTKIPFGAVNGRAVEYRYFCSDMCPQNGYWAKYYKGVANKEECLKIGGEPETDMAWGGFVGCKPK